MKLPTTKAGLLQGIRRDHRSLEAVLTGLSPAAMVKASTFEAWSVKDVLAHVSAWEKIFLNWYHAGLRGEKLDTPDFSKPGVLDEFNREIYEKNRTRPLEEVDTEFRDSFRNILKEVEAMPEEDLFVPGKCDWIKKETLAYYIWSNTGRHYAEHLATIEAIRKKYGI